MPYRGKTHNIREIGKALNVTAHELRLEPVWDPLRGDARFQQMLAKFGGK